MWIDTPLLLLFGLALVFSAMFAYLVIRVIFIMVGGIMNLLLNGWRQ